MPKRLFCEISPVTYRISVKKERIKRHIKNITDKTKFAKEKAEPLAVVLYKHSSLIRRQLGNVDMTLQENKAVNLSLAAPKINQIVIKPGETFSFWQLVGACTKAKGYLDGLMIGFDKTMSGTGGGMCQFTNLLHWLVLHSSLDIVEYHHHNKFDLFPDFGREIPFGCGTSIMYNYLDYRVKNNTDNTFQLITYLTGTHLCGELRAAKPLETSYHIVETDKHFVEIGGVYYRRNKIYRRTIDKRTGQELKNELLVESNARVMYDATFVNRDLMRVTC
jgi:vancomycin resistance protein VanW